jgi:hypothetical protein
MFVGSCFVGRFDVAEMFESLMKMFDGYCEGDGVVGRWWCGNGAADVRISVGNCYGGSGMFDGSVKLFGSLVKMFEGLNLVEVFDGLDLYDLKFDGFGFVGFDFVVGIYFVVGVDLV